MIEDEKYSESRSKVDGIEYSRILKKPNRNIPELKNVLTDEIIKIVNAYYGNKNFKVTYLDCWRNHHVPIEVLANHEILSDRWHSDEHRIDQLHLIINLSDVTEDDGPFHIQSLERTKDLIKSGYRSRSNYRLSDEIMEDPNHVVKATGPKGTAILANTELCLHKAGNPLQGHIRDIITFLIIPSSKPLPENWIENAIAYNSV